MLQRHHLDEKREQRGRLTPARFSALRVIARPGTLT
jgi:hypothetical protein